MQVIDIYADAICNILFCNYENEHEGLRILFEFHNNYLYFNGFSFHLQDNKDILSLHLWRKVEYQTYVSPTLKSVKEDEMGNYFIMFADDSIFNIYQAFNGDFWWQEFQIVDKQNDINRYKDVEAHMNEYWIIDSVINEG